MNDHTITGRIPSKPEFQDFPAEMTEKQVRGRSMPTTFGLPYGSKAVAEGADPYAGLSESVFGPVQSTMEAEIAEVTEERSRIDEIKAEMAFRLAFVQRFRTGKLTLAEYKGLNEKHKRSYVRIFGRPKTADEARGFRNRQAKAQKAKRAEKQARKQARR